MANAHAVDAMFRLHEIATAALAQDFPRVNVELGPLPSGDPDDCVYIGYDGDPFGDMEMAVHTEEWGAIGKASRDEAFDIRCTILNRSGASDAKAVRAAIVRLYGVYRLFSAALQADPSIGLGPPLTPYWRTDIRAFGVYMALTETGVEPRLSFSVHCETRQGRN